METTVISPQTVSFFVPFKVHKRGGHKMIVLPEGEGILEPRREASSALLKALLRATLWERQLRAKHITMEDLAKREGVSRRYIQRILQLNFLAPDIKEAILEGRPPATLRLEDLRIRLPLLWVEQRERLGFFPF